MTKTAKTTRDIRRSILEDLSITIRNRFLSKLDSRQPGNGTDDVEDTSDRINITKLILRLGFEFGAYMGGGRSWEFRHDNILISVEDEVVELRFRSRVEDGVFKFQLADPEYPDKICAKIKEAIVLRDQWRSFIRG